MTPTERTTLTDEKLIELAEILSPLMTFGNSFGRCGCNGCDHIRDRARDWLSAALAAHPQGETTTETFGYCALCCGTGQMERQQPYGSSSAGPLYDSCNHCGGTGRIVTSRTVTKPATTPREGA